jgi:hypothetical protein
MIGERTSGRGGSAASSYFDALPDLSGVWERSSFFPILGLITLLEVSPMATGLVQRRRFFLAAVAAIVLIPLASCEKGIRRVPVSGTVTLDGQPLQGGVLMFNPDESKGNTARVGCSGPVKNGRYSLVTAGVTQIDTGTGAPLGWYKVTLLTDLPGTPEIKVDKKYLRPETTPLQVEIVENPKPGHYDLQLTK